MQFDSHISKGSGSWLKTSKLRKTQIENKSDLAWPAKISFSLSRSVLLDICPIIMRESHFEYLSDNAHLTKSLLIPCLSSCTACQSPGHGPLRLIYLVTFRLFS